MDLSLSSTAIDALFGSTIANTQARLDALGGTVLGQGIDYFQNGKYEQAIKSFRQAAALSPLSDNSVNAYTYMGQAYSKLGKTEQAIKTYQEAARLYPADDRFQLALGDLYLQEEMLDEAITAYEKAIQVDPNNNKSRYSLGESYLKAGHLDKAYEHFNQVVRISPDDPAGYYGLGEVARATGDPNGSILLLNKSIRLNKDFELAYRELGYAYADMGEFYKAQEQLMILEANDSKYASDLQDYMAQVTRPQIIAAYSTDGFNAALGPKTEVSSLSTQLGEANRSKLFSMTVRFSKDMDKSSVINSGNWTISRATIRNNGGVYNYGMPVTSKEAAIATVPAYVTYDEENAVATVYFRISQNNDANATIDPEHIVFKFSGVDAYGKAMDTSADEYSGFSGIA